MQSYDNPVKNQVRSWGFASLDRFLPTTLAGKHALYLPGEQNLEGPFFAERGIIAHPVERSAFVRQRLCNSRVSSHPLKRHDVFLGSLGEAVFHHAQRGIPRLCMVSADFEGKIESCAEEVIGVFRLFPEYDGGFLAVTTFANFDGQSVEEGIVFTNAFDNILQGEVKRGLDRLYNQLHHYLEKHARPNAVLCHAQFSRDFSLLWRILLGMALFDQPAQGAGKVNKPLHACLTQLVGEMHKTSLSTLAQTRHSSSMRFFEQPDLMRVFEDHPTNVLPITLERILYKSRRGNRMSTWFLSVGRLRDEVSLKEATNQLWQLYSRSPLVYINGASPEVFLP